MDLFGKDFKKHVLNAVKRESKRLENEMGTQDQHTLGGPKPTSTYSETAYTLQQPSNPQPTSTISGAPETLHLLQLS